MTDLKEKVAQAITVHDAFRALADADHDLVVLHVSAGTTEGQVWVNRSRRLFYAKGTGDGGNGMLAMMMILAAKDPKFRVDTEQPIGHKPNIEEPIFVGEVVADLAEVVKRVKDILWPVDAMESDVATDASEALPAEMLQAVMFQAARGGFFEPAKEEEPPTAPEPAIDDILEEMTADLEPDANPTALQPESTEQVPMLFSEEELAQYSFITAEPDVSAAKPDVGAPEPDVPAPEPEVPSPEPDVPSPEPGVSAPQPVAAKLEQLELTLQLPPQEQGSAPAAFVDPAAEDVVQPPAAVDVEVQALAPTPPADQPADPQPGAVDVVQALAPTPPADQPADPQPAAVDVLQALAPTPPADQPAYPQPAAVDVVQALAPTPPAYPQPAAVDVLQALAPTPPAYPPSASVGDASPTPLAQQLEQTLQLSAEERGFTLADLNAIKTPIPTTSMLGENAEAEVLSAPEPEAIKPAAQAPLNVSGRFVAPSVIPAAPKKSPPIAAITTIAAAVVIVGAVAFTIFSGITNGASAVTEDTQTTVQFVKDTIELKQPPPLSK